MPGSFPPPIIDSSSPTEWQLLQEIINNTAGGGGVSADVNIVSVDGNPPDFSTETTLEKASETLLDIKSVLGSQSNSRTIDSASTNPFMAFVKGILNQINAILSVAGTLTDAAVASGNVVSASLASLTRGLLNNANATNDVLGSQLAGAALPWSNSSIRSADKGTAIIEYPGGVDLGALATNASIMVVFPRATRHIKIIARSTTTARITLNTWDVSNQITATQPTAYTATPSGNFDNYQARTLPVRMLPLSGLASSALEITESYRAIVIQNTSDAWSLATLIWD